MCLMKLRYIFFRILQSSKEQNLPVTEILSNIINIFTDTLVQFNVSLLN